MSGRLWLLLLLAQALWAGTYAAMKFAGDEMPVGAIVVLRYGLATAGYLLLAPAVGLPRLERRDWGLAAVLGALNFALAPTLQVTSLRYTRTVDVAILVALEPVLTMLLARLVLGERPASRTWGATAVGIAGMLILSGVGAPAGAMTGARLFGNGLFLASMLCEVAVTVAGARLARRYDPLPTMAAMKAFGFVTAAVVYFPVMRTFDPSTVSLRGWASLLYLAFLGSLFSYTVWYYAIRKAPVNQAALSLLAQPLIGVALGYFLVGERLGVHTLIGGGLIVLSLAWWQIWAMRRANSPLMVNDR